MNCPMDKAEGPEEPRFETLRVLMYMARDSEERGPTPEARSGEGENDRASGENGTPGQEAWQGFVPTTAVVCVWYDKSCTMG